MPNLLGTRPLVIAASLALLLNVSRLVAQSPPDATWATNASLERERTLTIDDAGAIQGVSFHDGKIYIYGDVHDVQPRVGVIREYTHDYEPTGRSLWLRRGGLPLLVHPTGLTFHPNWGTFLGDTVNGKGAIYRIDWDQAWSDGNLDHAVMDVIDDDAAINGSRPEFVTVNGKDYLATADYGDIRPEIRLYDPERLLAARHTSAPGVVAFRVLCGPFNQNLHWNGVTRQLTCVQNVIAGRGWRLDVLDLAQAVADGRVWGPNARVRTLTFPPYDELEGYCPLNDNRGLFVSSLVKDNLVVGVVKPEQVRIGGPFLTCRQHALRRHQRQRPRPRKIPLVHRKHDRRPAACDSTVE